VREFEEEDEEDSKSYIHSVKKDILKTE